MSNEPADSDDAGDLWIIPLHGIEAPVSPPAPRLLPFEDAAAIAHFYDDEELPNIEFRPQLRRSA